MMGVRGISPQRAERFWESVQVGDHEACWEWTAHRNNSGYGVTSVNGVATGSHRVAYRVANGPIPEGMFVCHSCDNKPCCNPAHLWLGTNKENIRDAQLKGLIPTAPVKPEREPIFRYRAPRARLTEDQVREIRDRYESGGVSVRSLAQEYDVGKSQIARIVDRQTWKWVA